MLSMFLYMYVYYIDVYSMHVYSLCKVYACVIFYKNICLICNDIFMNTVYSFIYIYLNLDL